jgi:rubredoxin---NAD+ reductase
MTQHPLVILGSGLAGYTLAREFRKLQPEAPLHIISQDHAGFYSKPMLSNALAAQKTAASLVMKDAEKMAVELKATIQAHTCVTHLNTATRQLTLGDNSILHYRDVVLAIGATPRRLELPGDGANEVISVNNLDDYAQFTQRLSTAKTALILGAGLIGCEFANDLISRQISPTVVDPATTPLPLLLPPELGLRMQQKLEAAGARFCLGTTVTQINREANGLRAHLSDGSSMLVDVIVSAVGLRPNLTLAVQADLSVAHGIVVNRHLSTSAEHVYAMGDCAQVDGTTLPYVMPIMQQARALAATLAGTPTLLNYPAMPVTVKTPACPTVVCSPPPAAQGAWHITLSESSAEAHYRNSEGALLGFALMGTATAQRQSLVGQVGGWWE